MIDIIAASAFLLLVFVIAYRRYWPHLPFQRLVRNFRLVVKFPLFYIRSKLLSWLVKSCVRHGVEVSTYRVFENDDGDILVMIDGQCFFCPCDKSGESDSVSSISCVGSNGTMTILTNRHVANYSFSPSSFGLSEVRIDTICGSSISLDHGKTITSVL